MGCDYDVHRGPSITSHVSTAKPSRLINIGTMPTTNELGHAPSSDLRHHLDKIVAESRVSAADLAAQARRASFRDVALHPVLRFWREYILPGGTFAARVGSIHAGMSAASGFFKYAFLWEIGRAS